MKDDFHNPEDFKIAPIQADRYDIYDDFLVKHFISRAPICRGLGVDPEEIRGLFKGKMKSWLSSGASVCATYVPTNKVAGLMLAQILTRDDAKVYEVEKLEHCSEKIQILAKILDELENSVNLFEDESVKKVLEIAATAVQSKFSGNKLTYRLTEECEKLGVELGCQLVTTQSTNVRTQHIRAKMGYEDCYTLTLEDYEFNGRRVINMDVMDGTTVAKVFKKYLNK